MDFISASPSRRNHANKWNQNEQTNKKKSPQHINNTLFVCKIISIKQNFRFESLIILQRISFGKRNQDADNDYTILYW